jgi:Domain of unknown function (DUF4342)
MVILDQRRGHLFAATHSELVTPRSVVLGFALGAADEVAKVNAAIARVQGLRARLPRGFHPDRMTDLARRSLDPGGAYFENVQPQRAVANALRRLQGRLKVIRRCQGLAHERSTEAARRDLARSMHATQRATHGSPAMTEQNETRVESQTPRPRGAPDSNREERSVSGEDLLETIRHLIHEGNFRRIIIRNDSGHTLLEIPLTIGLVGALLLPVWAAIGAMAALATGFTIVIERPPAGPGERPGPQS